MTRTNFARVFVGVFCVMKDPATGASRSLIVSQGNVCAFPAHVFNHLVQAFLIPAK